jgi:hypothetical protein
MIDPEDVKEILQRILKKGYKGEELIHFLNNLTIEIDSLVENQDTEDNG